MNFLGSTLDESLNWSSHINYRLTVPKICRSVFLLRKLINCVPLEFERKSYLAFFQSHVRYGLLIWDGFSNIEFVLLVQKTVLVKRNPDSATSKWSFQCSLETTFYSAPNFDCGKPITCKFVCNCLYFRKCWCS